MLQDWTELGGELSPSDLRADQFTPRDYARAGFTPPLSSRSVLLAAPAPARVRFSPLQEEATFETVHINSPRFSKLVKQSVDHSSMDLVNYENN